MRHYFRVDDLQTYLFAKKYISKMRQMKTKEPTEIEKGISNDEND